MTHFLLFDMKPNTAYHLIKNGEIVGRGETWWPSSIIDWTTSTTTGDRIVFIAYEDTVVSGVDEADAEAVKVYPNPNDGRWRVESTRAGFFELYDAAGREVGFYFIYAGGREVDGPSVSGIYFWKMNTARGKVVVIR